MAGRQLTGILLVGGASRRFGSPKALAPFQGKTLAERAWGVLGEVCQERLAFGKPADELGLPFSVLDDGIDVRAPLAGVVAGLRIARNAVCVFLPVDVPLATPSVLRALGDACEEAAVTQTGPLPAAFVRGTLPVLERRLARGEFALRDALSELETAVVEADPALLVNVNVPEQLAAL
jgi:molybdopterin-guanine dinucleotide biosynthesis protein A